MDNQITPIKPKRPLPAPNPITKKAYRRDVLRQITFPLILLVITFIALVIWLISANIGTVEEWSSISLILMIVPALFVGLILIVLLIALIFMVNYVLKFLPPYARLTQEAITNLENQIKSGADISAKPIIQIKSFIAVIDILLGKK